MSTKTIRCSSLPLIEACPQAAALCEVRIGSPRDAADVGSAAHQVLTSWIGHGMQHDPEQEIHNAATKWSVDADELTALVWRGWTAWKEVMHLFPEPLVEQELRYELPSLTLTGHADVISAVGDELRICDLKTGRIDADHGAQLRGYALLALNDERWPLAIRADCYVLRVRDQTIDRTSYMHDELASWVGRLMSRVQEPEYRPGRQCSHCPRAATCPAIEAVLTNAMELVSADSRTLPGWSSGEAVGAVYDAVKQIEKFAERAQHAVRAYVAANGPQDLGDGRQLALNASERKEINVQEAYPVLTRPDRLGIGRTTQLLKIGKGDVEAAYKAMQPKGQGARAWRELLGELEGAGAVIKHTTERLECRRVEEPKPLLTETA